MPAVSSFLIDPAIGYLVDLSEHVATGCPGLLEVLGQVIDPRKPRGVRHSLGCVLMLALCAVLAGARSFVAIAEWAADAGAEVLAEAGARRGAPSESTFRRTLQRLDGDDLDQRLGSGPRPGPPRPPAACWVWPWMARPCVVRPRPNGLVGC